VVENTKSLLRLYVRPAAAMSEILDRGSMLFAVVAVIAVSLFSRLPIAFYVPLLVLAAVYVPGVLLLSITLARTGGSFGAIFQRDFAPLLTCTAMAWSAAYLPLAAALSIAARLTPPNTAAWPGYLAGAASLYFFVLMFFAVRTVFGTENGTAIAVVSLSWIPLLAAYFLWGPIQSLLGWLASPFVLFFLYYYLRSEAGNLGAGLRNRQNFRRMLDAAAINPHDAEAQYQLGLIYQQRHQLTEAIQRFQNAVAIDNAETDAHFQLGRIARQQGRLKDALIEFQTVLDQNEKHHQSEVLRELGALYNSVRQFEDARQELARYIERRPYDPEGLYYYGQSLEGMGQVAEAREVYVRSIEAARAAPLYLSRAAAKWSRLAQKRLRA
jgi:tetratricopeptide (TPR) repeat protein